MKFEPGPDDIGERLDVFLSRRLPDWTRSQLKLLNNQGGVRVDGRHEKGGYRLRGGEGVEVELPVQSEADIETIGPEPIALHVHFEDDHFAVVEKPAGLVVHPGAGNREGTLVHALRARFRNLSDAAGAGRPGIVHRLDRWTSGLIVVAKSNAAHARISRSFQNRKVRKTYVAGVHGRMAHESGVIDLPIERHPTKRTRMAAGRPGGREARSDYRVRDWAPGFSLLDVSIQTGRTHQIRVHLAAIGHPVLGDTVYGEKLHRTFERRHGRFERYFLHAAHLAFAHPESRAPMEFASEIPGELVQLWSRLSGRE